MCVLMIFAGLVAYLGTMIGGLLSYLRFIFIMVFGIAAEHACIGAMALISESPDHNLRHFAPIVSRLTFLVASLAFEGAVFYLLGEGGFIMWLVAAASTIFGMMHFWRVGHPESLSTLIAGSCAVL
ncbi:hypothetical protein EJB05_15200 [Eragrostis curvula]|uniref:Uncharacterized protein n=1 Tax=Eragrostis curvula TaxID=38414 RepID=A0A5J9W139_9POAL|nr:hypothetical protein EJB05_15200 [Eragrostis curvula]